MPRKLSDAALGVIGRTHSATHNLIYLSLDYGAISEGEMYLAVDSVSPVLFQRTEGPIIDDFPVQYEPAGGAIVPGTVEETSDISGQGQEIQFVAVDPDFVLGTALLQSRSFNRTFQHWRIHIDESGISAGTIKAAILLMHGKLNGGFTITDVNPEEIEGAPPGTILVRFRVNSPLALIDVKRSIQTNLRSHQRWYPGDMGMEWVGQIQGRHVWWGVERPE